MRHLRRTDKAAPVGRIRSCHRGWQGPHLPPVRHAVRNAPRGSGARGNLQRHWPGQPHHAGLPGRSGTWQAVDAFAAYRAMSLANCTDAFSTTGVREASGRSGNFAGHQVEARVRFWLAPGLLRAEVNGVWLAKGRFLKTASNTPATADTLYMATGMTASFRWTFDRRRSRHDECRFSS